MMVTVCRHVTQAAPLPGRRAVEAGLRAGTRCMMVAIMVVVMGVFTALRLLA